jgi:hypothetical protein
MINYEIKKTFLRKLTAENLFSIFKKFLLLKKMSHLQY